jgi:hypothetical protein
MLNTLSVPENLRASVTHAWEQFEASRQAKQLPDLASLLPDTMALEVFEAQLVKALAASEFVANTCAIKPQLLIDLVRSGNKSFRDNFLHALEKVLLMYPAADVKLIDGGITLRKSLPPIPKKQVTIRSEVDALW